MNKTTRRGPPRGPDLTGRVFERLTVIARVRDEAGRTLWKCLCSCGREHAASATHLQKGRTLSCGCLRLEKHTTHGMSGSRVYGIWQAMKDRCTNPANDAYAAYGGRGIGVCERWLQSFENFLEDMGEPAPAEEIDRYPNNDGNYEPGNCRWASRDEQVNNTRANVHVTVNGQRLSIPQAARAHGMKVDTLRHRLFKLGMSADDAVKLSVKKYKATPTVGGC